MFDLNIFIKSQMHIVLLMDANITQTLSKYFTHLFLTLGWVRELVLLHQILFGGDHERSERSEGQLISLHSERRTLPDPGRLGPLLQSPQSLLARPAAEDEGLWSEHSHNVSSECN